MVSNQILSKMNCYLKIVPAFYFCTFALVQNTFAQKVQFGFFRAPCPSGYVHVQALSSYTSNDFCVMKYEAKNVGGIPKSVAAGTPWVSIDRGMGPYSATSARKACVDLGLGYDLISNSEWQTIVRRVADTPWNWDTGVAYNGKINMGHVDGAPNSMLAADVDDRNACSGTGQTCSDVLWDNQRRTNKLSNGSVLWDLGGNADEWVKDESYVSPGATDYTANFNSGIRQTNFGNDQFCASPSVAPYCGFGYGYVAFNLGTIARGGTYTDNGLGGPFGANLAVATGGTQTYRSFRCVFHPTRSLDPCEKLSPEATPAPGTACAGGSIFAGIYNGARYMVTPGNCTASTTPTCNNTPDTLTKAFSTSNSNTSATSVSDGAMNTAYLVNDYGSSIVLAAAYCADMVYGGYSDWFLPAQNELINLLYPNKAAIGNLATAYWASNQNNTNNGFTVSMTTGAATTTTKSNSSFVRCIRRF
jgi:hypothetical protein